MYPLQISEELDQMAVSVAAMKSLPEYNEASKKLTELQTRLETMATPHLVDALSHHNVKLLSRETCSPRSLGRDGEYVMC